MDDEARFTRLYERFYPNVLAYATHRVVVDQAREVADETFLIAWRRLADIPKSALPWLLVTARNLISDQHRRGLRRDALTQELARCSETIDQPGVDAIVVERITVLGALARIGERDREALMLTVWDGLSSREAAAATGCSPATFAVRLHRARRRLTAEMEQLDDQYRGEPTVTGRSVSSVTLEGSDNEHPHEVRT